MANKKKPTVKTPVEVIEAETPVVEATIKTAIPPYTVPTAPGETGSAPLTRPTQRNESKWQQ